MEWRTQPCLHGEFCWHEVNTRDPGGTVLFYRELLGANATSMPMPHGEYTMLAVDEHTLFGVMPLEGIAPPHVPTHWLGYVAVDDVDLATGRAADLGAKVLVPVTEIPIGRWSLIAHAAGGTAALFQAAEGRTDGTNSLGPGAVAWNHLVTPDTAAAVSFWESFLGWAAALPPDGGADGARRMHAHGREVAGIMPAAPGETTAEWLPFIAVRDLGSSLRRAVGLGASVRAQQLPLAGIGTVAVLADPQGAFVALVEPAAR